MADLLSGYTSASKKKKEEESGLLGRIGQVAQDLSPVGMLSRAADRGPDASLVEKNIVGAGEFLRPDKFLPALIGGLGGGAASTAKEVSRALPTGIASLTGKPVQELEQSPLSFLVNTEAIKEMRKDQPLAEGLMGVTRQLSPLLAAAGEGIAETGIRGTAQAVAPIAGSSAEDLLAGTNLGSQATYGSRAQAGQLFPTIVQDVLTAAPAARGVAGGLEAAGAEAAGARLTQAANLAERAPLMPYTEPARGLSSAFKKAAAGETAFPGLAETAAQAPGPLARAASKVAGAAEKGAQYVGGVQQRAGFRQELINETAKVADSEGFLRQNATLDELAAELPKESPLHDIIKQSKASIQADINAFAKGEAKYNIQRGMREKVAAEKGVKVRTISVDDIPEAFRDANIERAFKDTIDPRIADNTAIQALDYVTKGWRNGVLAGNPAWQAGNIVNNSATAMAYAGVTPADFAKNNARVKAAMRGETTDAGAGAVIGQGQASQFMSTADPKTPIGRFANAAYKLNQKVDDAAHLHVYFKELDNGLAAGLDEASAIKAAQEKSLKTMGNFQNMSALEKDVIKRIVPFYAWSKHSTKFALREAMENPVRQLRYATAAEKLTEGTPEGEGLDFLRGQVPLGGGRFLRLPGGLEQGSVGAVADSPLLNPKALMGSLSPVLQAGIAAAGVNPRKAETLEAAPGQSRASATAGYLTNLAPGSKTIADLVDRYQRGGLLEGQDVIKGDVRNPLLVGGRPIADTKEDLGPIPAPLLKFFTGVSVDQPDVRGAQKRAAKKAKTEEKSAKKYEKSSKKKAK